MNVLITHRLDETAYRASIRQGRYRVYLEPRDQNERALVCPRMREGEPRISTELTVDIDDVDVEAARTPPS